MNSAFENFVVAALRDAVGVSERASPQGNRTLRLEVTTIDVSGSSDAILEQVRTVPNRIKAMSLSRQ